MANEVNGYRIRVYVGPCNVEQVAERIERAGYVVDFVGTEHVHYRAPRVDGWGAISACDVVAEATGLPLLGEQRNVTTINPY